MATPEADLCQVLDWDTAFWAFRVARLSADALTAERVKAIDAWCGQNEVRCLYFLARADSAQTTRLAEQSGFRLVDIRTQLVCRLGEAGREWRPPSQEDSTVVVRPYRPPDLPALRSIARLSHRDTRFFYDDGFPRRLCDLLYETWIERSCAGDARLVLVASEDSQPIGYVTCHLEDSADGLAGKIGLLAVAPAARGRGVGRALVGAAQAWFAAQGAGAVAVVTQGRNVPALRLYERCGFLTREVQLWYHKWYGGQGRRE